MVDVDNSEALGGNDAILLRKFVEGECASGHRDDSWEVFTRDGSGKHSVDC